MLRHFIPVSAFLLASFAIGGTVLAAPSESQGIRAVQQDGTCTGVVKDATGETIIGASVLVKGTTNGVITDIDGNFQLRNVKPGDIIQISYVGSPRRKSSGTASRSTSSSGKTRKSWMKWW